MSEQIIYEDRFTVLRRGLDEGWLYVEETYYPLPRYMNHVRYRISLSPSSRRAAIEGLERMGDGRGGLDGLLLHQGLSQRG